MTASRLRRANHPPLNLPFLLNHLRRNLTKPVKKRLWRRKSAPFWHAGIKGLQFELHPDQFIDFYIYTEGAFEKRFLYLIEALLPDRRTALDVGANIGNHALFFSTIFERVHAFEPNPDVFARLARNVERNAIANLDAHAFGLSDQNAALPFAPDDAGNAGRGSFLAAGAKATMSLPVHRGDDLVEERTISDIDLIKLDVEGHELPALLGLSATIARDRPLIAFEFHPLDFPDGYFAQFANALPGYAFFECEFNPPAGGGLQKAAAYFKNAGLPWLKPLHNIERRSYQNILAVPEGRRFNFSLPAA